MVIQQSLLRDGFFFFSSQFPTLETFEHSLCYPTCLFVLVLALAERGESILHTPGEWVVNCIEFALQESAPFTSFLATINRQTLKYCQGSRGSPLVTWSEGNLVCCPGLDFLQVCAFQKCKFHSVCWHIMLVQVKENKNLLVVEFYSNVVMTSGISIKIFLRLCIVPRMKIWESFGTSVWKESWVKEERKYHL